MKFLFILNLLTSYSYSDDSAVRGDYRIDWQYTAGEYLIYDCTRAHYACVDLPSSINCIQERKFAIEKKMDMYPCAPISSFKDKKACIEKNYKIVDINAVKRFCYPK